MISPLTQNSRPQMQYIDHWPIYIDVFATSHIFSRVHCGSNKLDQPCTTPKTSNSQDAKLKFTHSLNAFTIPGKPLKFSNTSMHHKSFTMVAAHRITSPCTPTILTHSMLLLWNYPNWVSRMIREFALYRHYFLDRKSVV